MSPIKLLDTIEVEQRLAQWRRTYPAFDALVGSYDAPHRVLRHFGLSRWAERDFDLAVAAFTTALSLVPQEARIWADLAGALNAAGRNQEAVLCIETALTIEPGLARAWLLLGTMASDLGDFAKAEAAFGRALGLEPDLADAHFGLGILYFGQRQFERAAEALREAIRHGNGNANSHICLGHVLYLTSNFAESAACFATAARLQPLDPSSSRKYGRASLMVAMIDRRIEEAVALYPVIAGAETEDLRLVTRDAFSLLSAHGHLEAAGELGAWRLERYPDDFIQRYLLDAVRGAALTRAPLDYVETIFDKFAKGFDHQLVDTLRYAVPSRLTALVAGCRNRFDGILDIGCGTGLAAGHLKAFGGRLIGIDLAAGMLEEAEKRGVYDELIKAEAVDFMSRHPGGFDLVFAADMLIYFGDLAPVMVAAADTLRPGGIFALSLEAEATADFVLRPSGRFAHTRAYVERLVARYFVVETFEDTVLRLEANRDVAGFLVVLRRT